MNDSEIVQLFWERSESAIKETASKYGRYCYRIANNILSNREDTEECVNDTYLRTWNSIPDKRPELLSTYLGKITRNLAINRYTKQTCAKRGGGTVEYLLDELTECVPCEDNIEKKLEEEHIIQLINNFLRSLKKLECNIFIRRYWYVDSINDICHKYYLSESKVKSILFRTRNKLKKYLEKEGIMI